MDTKYHEIEVSRSSGTPGHLEYLISRKNDFRLTAILSLLRHKQYGFDTLLENGIDPSHLPFAHHNIISNRNQAAYIDTQVDKIWKGGFDSNQFYPKRGRKPFLPPISVSEQNSLTKDKHADAHRMADCINELSERFPDRPIAPPTVRVPQSLHFRPPTLLYQVINVTAIFDKIPFLPKRERLIRIVTYAVPVAPGRSRVIYRFLRNYFLPPFSWMRWPPEWIQHQRILRVLDSDTVFLHGQERERALLSPSAAADVDRCYFMPTAADGSVRALRKWLARFGGPRWLVPDLSSLPPTPDRRTLLDRYESHTKSCKICRGALRNLKRLRQLIGFMSVMAFYLGLLGQSVYTRLAGGFFTVLGITGSVVIKRFEERFYFQPWDHGRN